MKIIFSFIIIFLVRLSFSATYFIDNQNGNDGNTGLEETKAWETLDKVNGFTFQPGDTIFFKAGGAWVGQIKPKGSGSASDIIVLDKYGEGPKPIIDGGGLQVPVVYLYNQEYWEINNLEITNKAATEGNRVGVRVEAKNYGTIDHIHLKNLYIHDISGIIGNTTSAKRTGGINIRVDSDYTPTRFNDILIENCSISTVDGSGISNEANTSDYPGTGKWDQRKYTNYIIRGNSINDVSKNAIIMRMADSTCLVERNVCWDTAYRTGTGNTIFSRSCKGTVFQYNEGYLNRTTDYDGCLYDADLSSPECIFQYSYSHDNNHGLFWTCTTSEDNDVICRYNISQNDKGNIFTINYPNTSIYIYNNTVYIGRQTAPTIISERNNGGEGNRTYYFYNNIIFNESYTAKYQYTSGYNRYFDSNCFYGNHPSNEPDDPNKITTNPLLVSPSTGGEGLETLDGYKLQTGSPCIDTGKEIEGNGGQDFFGNQLYNQLPDRGAHEYYDLNVLPEIDPKETGIPKDSRIMYNYPNPFNPSTKIKYELYEDASVLLTIFDVQGRKIKTIINERQAAGIHEAFWNASNDWDETIAGGIYFASILVNHQQIQHRDVHKLVYIK